MSVRGAAETAAAAAAKALVKGKEEEGRGIEEELGLRLASSAARALDRGEIALDRTRGGKRPVARPDPGKVAREGGSITIDQSR